MTRAYLSYSPLVLVALVSCVSNAAVAQLPPDSKEPSATSTTAPPAEEEPAASPPAAVEATQGSEVKLVVRGSIEGIDSETLARALERELGRPVVVLPQEHEAAGARLEIAANADHTLELRFYSAGREPLERTVRDPSEPGERLELVVLLGSSMVADGLAGPVLAVPAAAPAPVAPPPVAPPPLPFAPAHFSFVHPLATNAAEPNLRTRFSVSLIQGRVGRIEGFAFGGYQSARYGVEGIQLAYIANFSRALVEGAQFGFVANVAAGLNGLQVAGINVATGDMSGAQLGFFNVARGASQGFVFGSVANYVADFAGASLSFGANISQDTEGLTATIGVNVARDLEGVQVGAFNVARNVHGVQLGLINVAEDISGVPIGIISVSKSGGVHPMAWYSLVTSANFGVRFAARPTYSTLYGAWDVEGKYAGLGYELGASIPIALDRVFAEVSLSEAYLVDTQKVQIDAGRSLTELRGSLRFQVFDHLGFFAGIGYVGKVEQAPQDFAEVAKGEWYYEGLANFSAGILL